MTNPEGTVTRVTGVYVTIYRRDTAGQWRVAIEIRSRGAQQPLGLW
jgi:ketosteroid isomerase-like protein